MSGETVLIVEDEALIALHLSELLEKSGYRVIGPEYSGEVVLRKLGKSFFPDLILMDIVLAGSLDGIDTARQIRERFIIPLIFITALASDKTLERIQKIASAPVLMKPFFDESVLSLIGQTLKDPDAKFQVYH